MSRTRNVRLPLPALLLCAAVGSSGAARAEPRPDAIPPTNGDGLDTHLFRPALDSRGIVSVNGVDVLPGGAFSLGLVIDYGRGLLRAPGGPLVDSSFTGTFHVDYGVGDRAVVGVSAPVILMSGEARPAVTGWTSQAVDVQSLQHVALHGKLKLLSAAAEARGVGLAVAAQVGVPLTDAPRNAGADPSFWYWPSIVLEKRFGVGERLRVALEAGYRGHAASATTLELAEGRVRDGGRVTYGAGASYRVADAVDVLAETYGTYLVSDSAPAQRPSNEALGGFKVFVERSSYLVVAAGPRITNGFEAADLRGVIGFVFEPPAGDSDGDHVLDAEDDCPAVAGVRSSEPKQNGCPRDSDLDGVPDTEDACPYVKGVRTSDPRTNGCPPDDDGDGIPNASDACPQVPGIRTDDPRTNGCPPLPDGDHDGVPDAEDACPDVAGPRHPDPKRNGCPDVLIGPGTITVFEKILFRTASAEILPESGPILDKVAAALNQHPEFVLVEVAGHADERGAEQLNLRLTQARVDSVMRALAERGVTRSRLRAKGYGYYCPLEEGHDEEAWSRNRRVEFLVVKTAAGKTGVPLGCANAAARGVLPDPVP
jgi:outer membrane protein OmpA-like peptidoglycan-associated protein